MTIPRFTYELTIQQAFPEDGLNFGTAEGWMPLIQQILNKHLMFAKVEIKEIKSQCLQPEAARPECEHYWYPRFDVIPGRVCGICGKSEPATEGALETISEDSKRIEFKIRSKNNMDDATPEEWIWETLAVLESEDKIVPQKQLKAEGAEKAPERPKPLPTYNYGQLCYTTNSIDAYMDALESHNAELRRELDQNFQSETGKIEGIMSAHNYPGTISNKILHMEAALLKAEQEVKRLQTMNDNQTSTLCAYRDEARAAQWEVKELIDALNCAWENDQVTFPPRVWEIIRKILEKKGIHNAEETR